MKHSLLVLFFPAALAASSPALAQRVPWFSASLEIGAENFVGEESPLHSGPAILGAANARFFAARGVGFTATAAYKRIGSSGDIASLCVPSTQGGCKAASPGFGGWTGRLEVERTVVAHLAVGGSVGVGWYANTERSQPAGAHVLPWRVALIAPMSHIAASVAFERTAFRDFGGGNFHSNALLIGFTAP